MYADSKNHAASTVVPIAAMSGRPAQQTAARTPIVSAAVAEPARRTEAQPLGADG
jgi:hypothetical protein